MLEKFRRFLQQPGNGEQPSQDGRDDEAPARRSAAISTDSSDSDPSKKRIGELLMEAGLISRVQLEEALRVQRETGGKTAEILIRLGFIEPARFMQFLTRTSQAPSVDLCNYEIPEDVVKLVPREFALKHEVFPIDKLSRLLTLGMAFPLDSRTIQELEQQTGLRVKPVLCRAEDVRLAINRYYRSNDVVDAPAGQFDHLLESSMRLSGVVALIRKIQSLPVLPQTVHQVRQAMMNPEGSVNEVANLILRDPAIAAKVLSIANSVAYGFPNRVDDVRLAVALMGLREIYGIVLAASVIEMFDSSGDFDYQAFWFDSLTAAVAASRIARAGRCCEHGAAFTAGLLHDIGRLALVQITPTIYQKRKDSEEGALLEHEECSVGLTHAEAGYELALHWNLPQEIAEAIRFHHSKEPPEENIMTPLIALASNVALAVAAGEEDGAVVYAANASLAKAVKLSPEKGAEVYAELVEKREEIRENAATMM